MNWKYWSAAIFFLKMCCSHLNNCANIISYNRIWFLGMQLQSAENKYLTDH